MTQKELQSIAVELNKIIASNNPRGVTDALRTKGYPAKFDVIPANELEKVLMDMYSNDREKYIQVLRQVPYRQDITNWTTSPQTKDRIRSLAYNLGIPSDQSAKFDLSGVWSSILGAIGGTTVSSTTPGMIITEPAVKAGVVIILVILAILAIVLLYRFSKRTSS